MLKQTNKTFCYNRVNSLLHVVCFAFSNVNDRIHINLFLIYSYIYVCFPVLWQHDRKVGTHSDVIRPAAHSPRKETTGKVYAYVTDK